MRHILATLAVVGALLFSAGSAWKAEAGAVDHQVGVYKNLGAGSISCGTWTKDSNAHSRDPQNSIFAAFWHVNQNWVLGYITAFNAWGPLEKRPGASDISKGTNSDGITAWIDNWCRANPLEDITTGAIYLIEELEQRKGN